ncbi:MAG: transglutaminase family protein [Pseudomonadota bacterium]
MALAAFGFEVHQACMRFTITHKTVYRFAEAVELRPHRAMLRPRDGHHLRVVNATLAITPNAPVIWSFDVFGNSIAAIAFSGMAQNVEVTSTLDIERFPATPESMVIDERHAAFPVQYGVEERRDLASLLLMDDERGVEDIEAWLANAGLASSGSVGEPGSETTTTDALQCARNLMAAIGVGFQYEARYDEGTMRPTDMLARGSGTCRDYAFFMMEAARVLGFAARFATGYLYSPALDIVGTGTGQVLGAAATHAWTELFIPGIGWVDFDATNNLTGTADLIKVATVRKPSQAIPLSGSFIGSVGAGGPPEVSVAVSQSVPNLG